MNIISCAIEKNSDCLTDYTIDFFIEYLIFSILLVFLIRFFSALKISKDLIKKNSGKLGAGYGTQAARVFFEAWQQDQMYSARHEEFLGSGSQYQPKGLIATRYLLPRNLVEIYQDSEGRKKFRAIKNVKNWLIFKIISFFIK